MLEEKNELKEPILELIEEECCGKCEEEPEIYESSFSNDARRNLFFICLVCVIIIIVTLSLKY